MKIRHFINFVLSGILVLLGFSACVKGEEYVEYGTPTIYYEFKGVVTSPDGTVIKGINVLIKEKVNYDANRSTLYTWLKTSTDAKGLYDTGVMPFIIGSSPYVVFQDVDGANNGGTYKNDSIMKPDLTIKKIKDGDGFWNNGTYILTGDIEMQKADK